MPYKALNLILAAFLFTGCEQDQKNKEEPPPVPVLAASPTVKDIPVYIESIGTLLPSVYIEVRPQVGGVLDEVFVHEGDWVQKGTPLFKIDQKTYLIKAQEAEAQLSMDRAALQAAEKKLERFESLAQKDLIAKTEWDELETQAAQSKAAVEADEARLNAARLDLERCTLASPVDGRIGRLDVHPGQLVSAAQTVPLAAISKMDPLTIEFTVTEKEFPKFPKGAGELELHSLSSHEYLAKGTITFIDNQYDKNSGLLIVRGKVENPSHALRPGQNVGVKVPVAMNNNALLIPHKAVKYNDQGTYVYVVEPDRTVGFRQVRIGDSVGSDVIITEGISASENVITEGHLRLYPGTKVEVSQ